MDYPSGLTVESSQQEFEDAGRWHWCDEHEELVRVGQENVREILKAHRQGCSRRIRVVRMASIPCDESGSCRCQECRDY